MASEELQKLQAALWKMQNESMAMKEYCTQVKVAAAKAITEGDAKAKAKIQEIREDANKYKQVLKGVETMVEATVKVASADMAPTIDARVLKAMVSSGSIDAPSLEGAIPDKIVDDIEWPDLPDAYKTPN